MLTIGEAAQSFAAKLQVLGCGMIIELKRNAMGVREMITSLMMVFCEKGHAKEENQTAGAKRKAACKQYFLSGILQPRFGHLDSVEERGDKG